MCTDRPDWGVTDVIAAADTLNARCAGCPIADTAHRWEEGDERRD